MGELVNVKQSIAPTMTDKKAAKPDQLVHTGTWCNSTISNCRQFVNTIFDGFFYPFIFSLSMVSLDMLN